jgi:methyl acetate hydrolase
MRRASIAFVIAIVALAGLLHAAQAPMSAAARLDERLKAAVNRGEVPGVVAIAADRNGIIYSGAFGMRDTAGGRPMTTDTIFRIASMTKAVTSTALMQLVEQRRVALDDPVDKYLPAFRRLQVVQSFDRATGAYTLRSASRAPTVRELMTHTSGLAYNFVSPTVRDFTPRDGDSFEAGPLLFDPGERWQYGPSTFWIGRIVEAVSGTTLDAYLHDRILQPLMMRDTSFNVRAEDQPRVATLHTRQRDGLLFEQPARSIPTVTEYRGDGGLFSTAVDYIRFEQMVLNGGRLNGAVVLSPKTIDAMAANQLGSLTVPALKTAMPERSSDLTFIDDGHDTWGLAFLITARDTPGKRSAGSLSWGGIDNTYFWIDRRRGVAGVIMMQFLPFADATALAVYDAFERGTYEILSTRRSQ